MLLFISPPSFSINILSGSLEAAMISVSQGIYFSVPFIGVLSSSTSDIVNHGYWLETPHATDASFILRVFPESRYISHAPANATSNRGVRPVIEVPKTSIDY